MKTLAPRPIHRAMDALVGDNPLAVLARIERDRMNAVAKGYLQGDFA